MRNTENMLRNEVDYPLLESQVRLLAGAVETLSNRIDDLIATGASKEVLAFKQDQLEALVGLENFVSELLWSLSEDGIGVEDDTDIKDMTA
jgi:hypothetical protein